MIKSKNPRDKVSPTQWAAYVAWQKHHVDRIKQDGVWCIPAAAMFVELDHENKCYDVHFAQPSIDDVEVPEEQRQAHEVMHEGIVKAMLTARKKVAPTMIGVFTDMGWKPNIFMGVDPKLGRSIEAALRNEAPALEIGGIVKLERTMSDSSKGFLWQTVFSGLMAHMESAKELFKAHYGDRAKLTKF